MQKRRLGRSGLEASAIGLGCLSFSNFYGAADPVSADQARRLIEHAIALGITFFDTAEMYGQSENLLGQAISGHRQDLIIATKFGVLTDAGGRPTGTDGSPAAVSRSCDNALRRLGIDVIDLFYLHRIDRAVPVEETVGAMADLVRNGKVRHLGLCEVSARTLRRAHRTYPIAALQSEYSLWSRDVETEILPVCRELGIGFVPYSPLGRGFLAGGITSTSALANNDARRAIPRFQGDNLTQNLALLTELRAVAAQYDATSAQIALAWVLARGDDVVPIPGTKHERYLSDNVAAIRLKLTKSDTAVLENVFSQSRISGERFGEQARRFADG